jgi:hypothetical protein
MDSKGISIALRTSPDWRGIIKTKKKPVGLIVIALIILAIAALIIHWFVTSYSTYRDEATGIYLDVYSGGEFGLQGPNLSHIYGTYEKHGSDYELTALDDDGDVVVSLNLQKKGKSFRGEGKVDFEAALEIAEDGAFEFNRTSGPFSDDGTRREQGITGQKYAEAELEKILAGDEEIDKKYQTWVLANCMKALPDGVRRVLDYYEKNSQDASSGYISIGYLPLYIDPSELSPSDTGKKALISVIREDYGAEEPVHLILLSAMADLDDKYIPDDIHEVDTYITISAKEEKAFTYDGGSAVGTQWTFTIEKYDVAGKEWSHINEYEGASAPAYAYVDINTKVISGDYDIERAIAYVLEFLNG